MTIQSLTDNEDFESICDWLNENLVDEKSFVPIANSIPNVTTAGICFWFMKPEGYEEIGRKLKLTPMEPTYSRLIEGILYDLVYVASEGFKDPWTGNLTGNLYNKLTFEMDSSKEEVRVRKLSHRGRLRSVILPLLSDDILLNGVQNELDKIFSKYFKIFISEYSEISDPSKIKIDDKEQLITKLNPIFNLVQSQNNLSPLINQRIRKVFSDTKNRIINEYFQQIPKPSKSEIKKNSKITFELNGTKYILKYLKNRPRLFSNGQRVKVKPNLRAYIEENSLNIPLTNRNGSDKATDELTSDFFKYWKAKNKIETSMSLDLIL